MAPFLTFTDLSRQELIDLYSLKNPTKQKQRLKKLMKIDRVTGFESDIILDFHYKNLRWALQKDFEFDQISTFISIMKKVLEEMFQQRLDMSDSFEAFKAYLLMHSVHRPPYSTGIFNAEEAASITDYVLNTFYRHFKLYQFVYVTNRELQVKINSRMVMPAPCAKLSILTDEQEVDPREQAELAHLFTPPATVRSPPPGYVPGEDEETQRGLHRIEPVGQLHSAHEFETQVNERLNNIEKVVSERLENLAQKAKTK